MSNLQPNCCLKFDYQKVDQHAGGKLLIHDNKRSASSSNKPLLEPVLTQISEAICCH